LATGTALQKSRVRRWGARLRLMQNEQMLPAAPHGVERCHFLFTELPFGIVLLRVGGHASFRARAEEARARSN
jgi:hypothetical protein